MYDPEGAPLTHGDLPSTSFEPKSISHSATRILIASSTEVISDASSNNEAKKLWSSMAQATPALFKPSSPRVQGYGFVAATPSPSPHDDIDPTELMTWGMIEGTPLLMDVDLPAYEPGPSFSMPETSERELLSNSLSQKATEAIKKRARGNTPQFKVPLSRTKTPLSRLTKSSGLESQLRASYSPKTTPSSRFTPTPVQQRARTPKVRSQLSTGTAKKDITDGLLDL
jgi:Nuclear protein Es2